MGILPSAKLLGLGDLVFPSILTPWGSWGKEEEEEEEEAA